MSRLVLLLLASLPLSALAAVGTISTLDGEATRTPKGGVAVALAAGAAVELGDVLAVTKGHLKFELADGSVIALAEKSVLEITEAEFEGQERKGFSALLKAGALWTKVKKAIGGAKFEVATERAVAGVRGTIFRIDADALVKAAKGRSKKASLVRVVEGSVAVRPQAAIARTLQAALARAKQGPRVEVAGPSEVSAEQWEQIFVTLAANQQIAVGVDLWEQAELDQAVKNDRFSKWLEQHP